MKTDLEEIKQIVHQAELIQARLDVLAARRSFTLDQQIAVRKTANTMRGLRSYDLSKVLKLFDPEYAEEMKRLTQVAKGEDESANSSPEKLR